MPEPLKVAMVGDIAEDEALVVDAATNGTGEDIAVIFSDGKYRAISDICTHEYASLADGWIEGDEVECPLHAARFHLDTGAALCLPATVAVKTYRTEVRGDEIWLHPSEAAQGAPEPS
ncbi:MULTISPECIES: non-heme iron oxygenase ferredoxin subunit [unclassified Luteococcus]|uniref:non-heme iron oxygenase ferredoxin subunit n=1 Tax=unclassified Luteococcus TaxID=2639923 RepID=UPI00313B0CDA